MPPAQASAQTTATPATAPDDISGMYSFEREGEFVQINVEQRTAKSDKTKPLADAARPLLFFGILTVEAHNHLFDEKTVFRRERLDLGS